MAFKCHTSLGLPHPRSAAKIDFVKIVLDAVQKYQWQLIDMKEDWLTVFAEPAPVSAPVSTQAPETV